MNSDGKEVSDTSTLAIRTMTLADVASVLAILKASPEAAQWSEEGLVESLPSLTAWVAERRIEEQGIAEEISNLKLQISNFKSQILSIDSQTSNNDSQTLNFKSQTSNFKSQASDFNSRTSSIEPQTSNFKSHTSNTGFLIGRSAADEFEILNMAVAPAHRRSGIGARLVKEALAWLRTARVRRVYLEVRASNEAAISLYSRIGFRPCGRRARYYTSPVEDAILLSLEVNRPPL
jgi:ribosomal-protein-alanine acetyltransferase